MRPLAMGDLPDPATLSVADVAQFNETSWRALAAVVAGHAPVEWMEPPAPEVRARAAGVCQRALEILHAEMIDDTRAQFLRGRTDGDLEKADVKLLLNQIPRSLGTLEDYVQAMREFDSLASGLEEMRADDGQAGKLARYIFKLLEGFPLEQRQAFLAVCGIMLVVWDVLTLYREDPDRVVPAEEFRAIVERNGR